MDFSRSNTALVVIDPQNDVLSEKSISWVENGRAALQDRERSGVWGIAHDRRGHGRSDQRWTGHFGRLDILVNNAGVFIGGAVDNAGADLAALHRFYAVNLFSW